MGHQQQKVNAMTQPTDKKSKPIKFYVKIHISDLDFLKRKKGARLGASCALVWIRLNAIGNRHAGEFFPVSLHELKNDTGLCKNSILSAIETLERESFLKVIRQRINDLKNEINQYKLLKGCYTEQQKTSSKNEQGGSSKNEQGGSSKNEQGGSSKNEQGGSSKDFNASGEKKSTVSYYSTPEERGSSSFAPNSSGCGQKETAKKPLYDFSGLSGGMGTPEPEIVTVSAKEGRPADGR